MKAILFLTLTASVFCVSTEHSYTWGMVENSIPLNYRSEGTVSISLTYTTEYLQDHTDWYDVTTEGKFDKEFDSWYDDDTD